MKTKTRILFLFISLVIILTSCANTEILEPCLQGQTYNFWWGLWHGLIAPINLVAMLFREDISVFAPNNNGAWYAFGFLLGSGGWGVFGGKKLGRRR
jgi:hypothetical protein